MTTQRAILTVLDQCDPYLLTRKVLHADVCRLLPREITLSELKADLGKLEGKMQIVSITDEDDGDEIDLRVKYRITGNGKARLRES